MLAALSSLCIAAHAGEDLTKDLVVSGYFDVYFQHSFNNPGTGTSLIARQFDTKSDNFTLSAFRLNIQKKTTAEDPFGFTVTLSSGRATDIMHAADPGGAETYKLIEQAYVTYAGANGLTLDIGKFYAWVGLESVNPALNDLYSISFNFYNNQPNYHLGLRATKPIGAATAALYVVNGWNEAEDSNNSKSYGATYSTPVGHKTTVTANYYGGLEGATTQNGFGLADRAALHLGDLVVVHQLTPSVKLSLNADYGVVEGDGAQAGGHFSGFTFTGKTQLNSKLSATLRFDTASDPNNIRASGAATYTSGTAGLEYTASPSSLFRIEFRQDYSNKNSFESDTTAKKNRSTLTLAHILKF